MSAAGLTALSRRLAALAAEAVLSGVLRRAVRRAHRELAAFDDRMLADIGIDRAMVEDLASINRRDAWMCFAQFPWHRLHTSAGRNTKETLP
jgi:uncharacterized protein YjiS (DUF1127 family)